MATLNSSQLGDIRQQIAPKMPAITYTKAQLDAATQAIENWFEANRGNLSNAINTATSPLVLTVGQKQILLAYYLKQKCSREGAA